ncbi:MAG: hypothetical protein WCT47_18220 [Betaproteobacteria bacterium]
MASQVGDDPALQTMRALLFGRKVLSAVMAGRFHVRESSSMMIKRRKSAAAELAGFSSRPNSIAHLMQCPLHFRFKTAA